MAQKALDLNPIFQQPKRFKYDTALRLLFLSDFGNKERRIFKFHVQSFLT